MPQVRNVNSSLVCYLSVRAEPDLVMLHSSCWHLALLTNAILGSKYFLFANALAYFSRASVKKKKVL